jgi:hypothetical protein
MRRAVAVLVVIAGATLGTTSAGADELPQAPEWVDVLPEAGPVEELYPAEELQPVPVVPEAVEVGAEPAGDLLVVDEETGGLSATGWFLLVLILVLITAPGWLLLVVPAAGVAIASAIGWRAAGHVGRRRMQRRLDTARGRRLHRDLAPFPYDEAGSSTTNAALTLATVAILAVAATLLVVDLTGGPAPELAGARRADQLMQGAGPPPSLPEDPEERACTVALMDSDRWSHAGAGNACGLGFVVDSPEAMGRCLAVAGERATEPIDGQALGYDERLATERYHADLCFLLYSGAGDLDR